MHSVLATSAVLRRGVTVSGRVVHASLPRAVPSLARRSFADVKTVSLEGNGRVRRTLLYVLPIGVAAAVASVLLDVDEWEVDESAAPGAMNATRVKYLESIPTRSLSRIWGVITHWNAPLWVRTSLMKAWAWKYNCNLDEMASPLESYASLAEFFVRPLKSGARVIDPSTEMVSPADGRILHLGVISEDSVEQVKGITYSMRAFLGADPNLDAEWSSLVAGLSTRLESAQGPVAPVIQPTEVVLHSQGAAKRQFYHCVIYLAPGDYHRFHSPTHWSVRERRHFAGQLFPVRPRVARLVPDLFVLNERVVLSGFWKHGYFAMAAVGAFNVGSVRLSFEESLKTNVKGHVAGVTQTIQDYKNYANRSPDLASPMQGLILGKGEEVGAFMLGSTIVLIFECLDKEFVFDVKAGDRVKVGQPLGKLVPNSNRNVS